MSKQKKGGIIKNFRLTLVDDDTHDKVWSKKFTRIGALVTAVTVIVVTIATIFCVIAFTPIRTLIPGYPDARSKHDAIKNAITIELPGECADEMGTIFRESPARGSTVRSR